MPQPLLELYGPQRRGKDYAAMARVHLRDGDVEIIVRAPKAALNRAMTAVHRLVAYHGDLKTRGAVKAALRRSGFRVSGDRIYGGGYVGGFWSSIAKGIATVTRIPAVKGMLRTATGAIPFVGPALAATGVSDMAIDAAGSAVDKATAEKASPKRTGARRAIATVEQQARSKRVARRAKALAAKKALKAMAGAYSKGGRRGLSAARKLARAAAMVKKARKGDRAAREKMARIVRRAKAGDTQAQEATAFLASARAALGEIRDLARQQRRRQAPQDEPYDEPYDEQGYDEQGYDEDEDYYDEDDEGSFDFDAYPEYEQVVGAQLARALSDQELVQRLQIYRQRKLGWRPTK